MIFRAATPSDVAGVVALLEQDWIGLGAAPDLKRADADYARMLADGGTSLFVAANESGLVATYQLTIIRGLSLTASCRAMVEGVRVRDDRRGQGIGALLMADAEIRAQAAGATLIQLTSNAARTRAHEFYLGLGYVQSHAGFKKTLG